MLLYTLRATQHERGREPEGEPNTSRDLNMAVDVDSAT